jgi:hypothetical protein
MCCLRVVGRGSEVVACGWHGLRPETDDLRLGGGYYNPGPEGVPQRRTRGRFRGMVGLTMDCQLTLAAVARRAEALFGDRPVVSRRADGRPTWASAPL